VSSPDEEALEDDFVSLSMHSQETELLAFAGAGDSYDSPPVTV
jgi:hypothetical protein